MGREQRKCGPEQRLPEELTLYRYDPCNLLYAENADAAVRRSYFPNGQVRTDCSYIRDFTGSVAFSKVYGIEYGCHEGWVTRRVHPGNLAARSQLIDKFAYPPGRARTSRLHTSTLPLRLDVWTRYAYGDAVDVERCRSNGATNLVFA